MRLPGLLALVLSLGLSGCGNMVLSREPLFQRDRAAEQDLKHGAWASPDPGCEFDSNAAVQDWPDCANGLLISRKSFGWNSFLAGGDPMIIQSLGGEDADRVFFYMALRPTARDGGGRIVGYETWFVLCGPPPQTKERKVTLTPGSGLTIDGDNCFALEAAAVRAAARASLEWTPDRPHYRWVRKQKSGDRDEVLSLERGLPTRRKDSSPPAPR